MLTRVPLYWHTVRHLRPVQVGGRIWSWLSDPGVRLGPIPPVRQVTGSWMSPACRRPSMSGAMTFSFLGETRTIGNRPWKSDASALWNYNLHYFDDLNALGAEARRAWHAAAIGEWIEGNLAGEGDGWDPYPTSLRAVNWIKYALGNRLDSPVLASLAMQIRWLERRLEYRLLGNHLFANAKALVFAGLFFQGDDAAAWLERGMKVLDREMVEQILPDGGQFERSPMYHSIALEDVLDLINLTNTYPDAIPPRWRGLVASWTEVAQRMRGWLASMCHPDGEISFFNDAAIGIAPSPTELERYADRLVGPRAQTCATDSALRLSHLAASGYVRAESNEAVVLIDAAPIGPDYLPGHAHADTLSFELSVFGERCIVNGGTSRYGTGPERDAERGTKRHSTATVDGEDSSEVWGGFRVARRARPFDFAIDEAPDRIRISCAHDGYRRLRGHPVHRRVWELAAGGLAVQDRIEHGFRSAVARYILHPSVQLIANPGDGAGELRLPSGRSVFWRLVRGTARIEESMYASEFGHRRATRCLAIEIVSDTGSRLELAW